MHTANSALESMQRSTRCFLDLVGGVSDSQWRLRPTDQEWSMAETVEHVVLSNRAILTALGKLIATPLAEGAKRCDDALLSVDMFRGPHPQPALAEPTGRLATRFEGVTALAATRDALRSWVNLTREIDLRGHGLPHPLFGAFDGVQWILFAAVHTDSHARQLRALRVHPEFALHPYCA
jgi:hypothetical protein